MSIRLSNVIKNFAQAENKIEVLKGVNLEIKKGEIISIVGDSGSGKSTLLSIMAGLDRPDSGQVEIADKEVSQVSEDEMTRIRGEKIGIVFQQYHLISHLEALENVMLPLEIKGADGAEDRAVQALEQVGLTKRKSHFPHQLSGGECQRVALARAIVHRPQLVLADEPSGNLDVETGNSVMELMFDIIRKNGMTLILVTHNPQLAKKCDKVYHLKNGQLELQ